MNLFLLSVAFIVTFTSVKSVSLSKNVLRGGTKNRGKSHQDAIVADPIGTTAATNAASSAASTYTCPSNHVLQGKYNDWVNAACK